VDVHAHMLVPSYQALLVSYGFSVPGYAAAPALNLPPPPPISAQGMDAAFDNEESIAKRIDLMDQAGVANQCFCLDRSIADDHFDPIYRALNERSAVVFFHPCVNGICSPFVCDWRLSSTAGTVFEDTVAALQLIAKQIPHRYSNIKFIVPHLGGALPMLLNRLDNQLAMTIPGLPEKPSLTARRFWYDTVGHGSKAACLCAVEAFGDRQILPGSDYPLLLPFERYAETFAYIRQPGLTEESVHRILYENARDVFGLKVDRSTPELDAV